MYGRFQYKCSKYLQDEKKRKALVWKEYRNFKQKGREETPEICGLFLQRTTKKAIHRAVRNLVLFLNKTKKKII